MNQDIQVIDNFLDQKDFDIIKKTLLGNNFPWFKTDLVVDSSTGIDNNYNWQLFHIFYNNPAESSGYLEFLRPLIVKISPAILCKVKANLNPSSERLIEHGYHVDSKIKTLTELLTTSIYYLNTNNGYTVFDDGTKIKSIENRLVSFPASVFHTGTNCTDEKYRAVINLNYISV